MLFLTVAARARLWRNEPRDPSDDCRLQDWRDAMKSQIQREVVLRSHSAILGILLAGSVALCAGESVSDDGKVKSRRQAVVTQEMMEQDFQLIISASQALSQAIARVNMDFPENIFQIEQAIVEGAPVVVTSEDAEMCVPPSPSPATPPPVCEEVSSLQRCRPEFCDQAIAFFTAGNPGWHCMPIRTNTDGTIELLCRGPRREP